MLKLGVDIGGTKIRAVLLDNKNRRFFGFNIATPKNKKAFFEVLEKEIGEIIKKNKISGIGIGLPGIVDVKNGVLIKSPNLLFLKNWQAKKFFSKFNRRVAIDNDSRCFLRAEAKFGAAKGYKNAIGLTIGTGIGGGIMIDGKIYYGKNSGAGEFGHTIIDDSETFEKIGAKKAFLKYGDRNEVIGIGVANLINSLDPEIVVLGGGGIISNSVKIEVVRKISKKYIMSPLAKRTLIVKGKLGENSQAIGAAFLV